MPIALITAWKVLDMASPSLAWSEMILLASQNLRRLFRDTIHLLNHIGLTLKPFAAAGGLVVIH